MRVINGLQIVFTKHREFNKTRKKHHVGADLEGGVFA